MRRYPLDEVVELMDQARTLGYAKENPLSLAKAAELFPETEPRLLKEVVSQVNLQSLDPFANIF